MILIKQRKKRIWQIDQQAAYIARSLKSDLGSWIRRRLKNGVESRTSEAAEALGNIRHTTAELREQWLLQKKDQLSIRSRMYIYYNHSEAHAN